MNANTHYTNDNAKRKEESTMNTAAKTFNVKNIEAITEDEARNAALESMQIKGHNVYFVDFGGDFGYSVLVFADGRHIYYANDYELHHHYGNKSRDELKSFYIDSLNAALYTEEEILSPLHDYHEYQLKSHYLHNYYGMRRERVSVFGIYRNDEELAAHRKLRSGKTFSAVSFAYYDDTDFVDHMDMLHNALEKQWTSLSTNYDAIKQAFIDEMYNHEYCINNQADWDTLSVFGNIEYDGDYGNALESYFDQLGFDDIKRSAYMDARKEYYRQINESPD